MKVSRGLLMQALKVAQSPDTDFAATVGLKELADRGLGQIARKRYRIDRAGRKALRDWLYSEGIVWTTQMSALNGDLIDTAKVVTNEKVGLASNARRRVLLAVVGHGVKLNGSAVPVIEGSFISISIDMIHEINAEHLLLVENKAAFEGLHRVAGAFERQGVLAVYRGDPATPYGQRWARDASKAYGIPLAAYMDFDPAGMAMGVSSGAGRLLLPVPGELSDLQGSPEDFRTQHIGWESIRTRVAASDSLAPWVAQLDHRRAGFTQERLIAHRINHQWVELREEATGGD